MKEHHKKWSAVPSYPKLRELILYIAKVSQNDERFGATKLNKILFYSDFIAYLKFGKPISEDKYQRLKNGPAPKHLKPIKDRMIEKQELAEQKVEYYGKMQCRSIALRDPDLSRFNADEIAIVDQVIRKLSSYTGTKVSQASHQFIGWEITQEGQEIPFQLALIDLRELTQEEISHGLSLEETAKKVNGEIRGYKMENLHGIKNLTKDSQGYVYWKGIQIEHYSYQDNDRERMAAQKLAADCRMLEDDRLEVSSANLSKLWHKQTMDKFPNKVRLAAEKIAFSYGIKGICDTPYIANIILEAL